MADPKVLTHPLVRTAIRTAEIAHAGQGRSSPGTPYLAHHRRVAEIVGTLDGVTEVEVAAAVLLDVLSNTPVHAAELTSRLVAGGAEQAVADAVVGLVTEVTEGFRSPDKMASASEPAKRLMLTDRIVQVTGGGTPDLAACDLLVDLPGDADPLLAGWLIHETNKSRNPNRKEG
jgi:(p)ppGpp synthase/HD superfamily hydrolase